MVLDHYLLAGLFSGDLDFLCNLFGHQGASAKWLYLWCLANQDRLDETFTLEGKAPRFPKRRGQNSLQYSFEVFKKNYLELGLTSRTKAKKAQVTQELSHSVVGEALADIPIDVVTFATMHVILGMAKKIYDYEAKLYARAKKLDKIEFRDEANKCVASLTLNEPILWDVSNDNEMVLDHYLLAGLFTGYLDFLCNLVGHQGASAKWLYLWCLANQDRLDETFTLEGKAPRFPKRRGQNSLQYSFEVFKKNYLELGLTSRTKAKKAQVTQELSHSVVGEALADIPIDVVTFATMHVILGMAEKIYDYKAKLYARLVEFEEGITVGNTTYQFRQSIREARDNAIEYCGFLKQEYSSVVDTMEGKRVDNMNIMREIGKIEKRFKTARHGTKQQSLIFRLRTLRADCEKNKTTQEEKQLYQDFVYLLAISEQTVQHCNDLLKSHTGNSERELVKALKANNVDISAYHGGSIVGNHCMYMGKE